MTIDLKIQIDARAAGAVASARFERFPDCAARLGFSQHAGEPIGDSELTRARAFSAGAAFVAVAVAHHADDVAFIERIPEHPFKDAPAGDELDERAEILIEIKFNVGVAPADVRA